MFRRLGDVAAASVQQLLAQAAARYGVDPSLVVAVAQRESGFNPTARNPRTGACGVMQLMSATAAAYGAMNCMDPVQNVDAGVHLLSDLLGQFAGDVAKAVAAYDWGSGNLSKAIAQWGDQWFSHAPAETRAYVTAIAGAPAAPPSQSVPLTIDASTDLPIEDATPTPSLWPAPAPGQPFPIMGLTFAAGGALLLWDLLRE